MGIQRRALVIGIDNYDSCGELRCAVRDAERLSALFERNEDGSINYHVRTFLGKTSGPRITRAFLREKLTELFDGFDGDILFYFSGHGAQTPWGGYLVTQDGTDAELGVSMEDLLILANRSRARDVVLILDCCHSGDLGNPPIIQSLNYPVALLREGVTILAASRPNEIAYETNGYGMFSDALAEGLEGGASDYFGNVNAASLFLYTERLFDAWDQCPLYKSHTARVPTIRLCTPPVHPDVLRSLRNYFSTADGMLQLDPEHESEASSGEDNPERARKRADAKIFKQLRDARLVESVTGRDFFWTAMNSESLRMTNLGRYFWRLLQRGKL
jgi:hypothetical protein